MAKADYLHKLLQVLHEAADLPATLAMTIVCRGVAALPGVAEVRGVDHAAPAAEPDLRVFPLRWEDQDLGSLCVRVDDAEAFAPYAAPLRECCALFATLLARHAANDPAKPLRVAGEKDEAALPGNEILFRTAFETASEGMCLLSLNGDFLRVNTRLCRMLGYSEEEFLRMNFLDVTPADDLGPSVGRGRRFFRGEVEREEFEKRYQAKDGSPIWSHVSVSLVRDEAGEPLYYVSTVMDITERKRAEAALRHAEQLLNDSQMVGKLGGWEIDAVNDTVTWTDNMYRLLGYEPGEFEPTAEFFIEKLVHPGDRERIREDVRQLYAKGQTKCTRYRLLRKDGSECIIQGMARSDIDEAGRPVRVYGTNLDVTEQVRAEEMLIQTEKMHSVGGLAAGMAHEINNPLGAIVQSSQAALHRLDPAVAANEQAARRLGIPLEDVRAYLRERGILRYLDNIREAGTRAGRIVRSMLSFSRMSGHDFEPTDIAALLDATVELAASDYDLKEAYDFRTIEIRRDYAPDMPLVPCVGGALQQVFFNILRNGAEAMHAAVHDASPCFELRLSRRGGKAVIELADNGPGMEEVVRKRILEPFYTTKGVGRGTGLGLSVSYYIITEQHGGTMAVHSEPGAGTRFVLGLPLAQSEG